MHVQAIPKVANFLSTEVIGEGLAAVNVEVVHHQVDFSSKRVVGDQTLNHLSELSTS
jgi:hypothetical protein